MSTPWEEGSPDRPICVLGEAPAKVEISWKRPLVGPSGEVFNDCLRASGIPRERCYILNVWPFMVEKNKKDEIVKNNRVLWSPKVGFTDDGLDAASEQIAKLKACKSNIVMTLGRPAMSLLTQDKRPIMKWRGSPLWSDFIGKKFIPTIHPAATIHGVYIWRFIIQNDMGKVALQMDTPDLKLPQRELLIAPYRRQVFEFMEECKAAGKFATDIEVVNHQVSCFSLSYRPDLALTVPLVNAVGGLYWTEEDEAEIWLKYAELMGDPNIMKVNQNIVGFDIPFLLNKNHIHTRGPIGDTMIAQHIMYPHFKKGLDFIASYHTMEPYWKDEGKIWSKMDITWDVFQRYCGKDSAVTLEAWDVLEKEMEEGSFRETYNMTVEMKDCLSYKSIRGLAVNKEGLEVTKVELAASIDQKISELDVMTEGKLNALSPKSCKEYFYEHLGIKPYVNQAGGITTDDKAMARIARRGIPGSKEAKLVQEVRALKKLKGTYVDVQLDMDNRLRCSWNPRGTWTGRLSSSKTILGTGMNLQNLHPKFKGFIVGG
jgi:uracil-DNA glycosylase family 4